MMMIRCVGKPVFVFITLSGGSAPLTEQAWLLERNGTRGSDGVMLEDVEQVYFSYLIILSFSCNEDGVFCPLLS